MLKDNGIEKPVDMNRDGYFISTIMGILGKGGLDGKDGTNGMDGIEMKKPKSSTRKYQCPCCGNSLRATKDLNILCMDCNEQFIKVEK